MEQQKERSSKKLFKISDLAKELDIKKSVLRLWEKEFNFCFGGDGELRGYSSQEKKMFSTIKDLICKQQLSMDAAKEQLLVFVDVVRQPKNEPVKESLLIESAAIEQASEEETFRPAEETILQESHTEGATTVLSTNENEQSFEAVAVDQQTQNEQSAAIPGAYLEKEACVEPVFIEEKQTNNIVESISVEATSVNNETDIVLADKLVDKIDAKDSFIAQCTDMKQRLENFKALLEKFQM